jgi:hypothetical protein
MFYKQTDERWAYEIMTHPKEQKDPDYLKDWGCLETTISNILTKEGKDISPKTLNEIIKRNKAYALLDNPDTPASQASYLLTWKLEKLYNFHTISGLSTYDILYSLDTYYIAKIRIKWGKGFINHFINVIEEDKETTNIVCFDVYDGKQKVISRDKILEVIKVKFFK